MCMHAHTVLLFLFKRMGSNQADLPALVRAVALNTKLGLFWLEIDLSPSICPT